MTILTATIAQINLGAFEIEGLMDEDGAFYIAIPQVADLIETSRNTASRDLKRMMGGRLKTSKLRTPFNKNNTNGISVASFEELLFDLALSGNEKATALSKALIGLSLTQVFSDAFGIKFEKADRERWLTTRFKTKHDFRPLTDKLQIAGFTQPWQYGKFVHAMQSRLEVEDGTRDQLEFEVLLRLERAQDRLIVYMEFGLEPYEALDKLNVKTL